MPEVACSLYTFYRTAQRESKIRENLRNLDIFYFQAKFQEVRNQEIIGAGVQQDRKSLVDNIIRHLLVMLAVLA